MPIKALLNQQPVMAWDVAGTDDFACIECGDAMYYRQSFKRQDGVRVTEHFAHKPAQGGAARSCSSVGQSIEHMNAKQAICLAAPDHFWWLNGIRGDVEVPLGQRRADVLFTRPDGRRIIFEPQFTKIPRSQIAERTRDYHALGCDVIWCFPEKRDDLYTWAKTHFYCVGQLSNDGNEVTFWGNLNPEKFAPGLRRQFDADTEMRDASVENAYKAWMSAGSMGLSAWLASYKERQTGKRFYTVEEYGDWVTKIRAMEVDRTGENNEFCQGA